jgi:hypothetical protein
VAKLTPEQLASALTAAGVELPVQFLVADREYAALKKDFLAGEFSRDLSEWIFELFGKYQPECRDCDDFSRFAAALAQIWNAATPGAPAALAFGEFWYARDRDGQQHAINIAIVENGEVVFYEPQTQKLVQLSDREKWTPTMIRF